MIWTDALKKDLAEQGLQIVKTEYLENLEAVAKAAAEYCSFPSSNARLLLKEYLADLYAEKP